MPGAALVFLLIPRCIAKLFTPDSAVVKTGAFLLVVAAFFQLFDGLQAVATGALRGAGDMRTPMLCHLVTYWLLGLPLGYVLCFGAGWGAQGLWAVPGVDPHWSGSTVRLEPARANSFRYSRPCAFLTSGKIVA